MSGQTAASRIVVRALAVGLLTAAAAEAQEPAEPTYDVRLHFGGLIAMVPKPATTTSSLPAAPSTGLAEFWILAPRGEDRAELLNAAARARNGGAFPVQRPSALHHAYLRVSARDLIRGACEAQGAACEAVAAATPDARLWLSLGAENPFAPQPDRRARYDIVVDAARPTSSGVTVDGLADVEGLTDGNGQFAQACKGCTSFQAGGDAAYTMPESGVADFAVPLGFRIGFRSGERANVGAEHATVTLGKVTKATRILLLPQGGTQAKHTILLKPAAGAALEVDMVNVPPHELIAPPKEPDQKLGFFEALRLCFDPPRMEHFRLLYLLAPRPGGEYVYDYRDYHAPVVPRPGGWCRVAMLNADPFCTRHGRLVSRK